MKLGSLLRLTALMVLAGALGASVSCGGGGGGGASSSTTTSPGHALVSGVVRNAITGGVIEGATVSSGSVVATTNASGVYSLSLAVSDRACLSVTSPDYAENQQVVAVTEGVDNRLSVDLLPATIVSIPNLDSDRVVAVPGSTAQVLLPADSLVTAVAGATPRFPITASLTPIDPTSNPRVMPGDYTTSAGQSMESFGALDVTFTDSNGSRLNLASGKTATIRIPASSYYWSGGAPASVPAFYFDTATGKWVEEGTLTLGGSGMDQYYEGTVAHFTTWNADLANDTAMITGVVIRNDGSVVAGATVNGVGVDYTGYSTATSGADGTFTLYVKAAATTKVTASLGYLVSPSPDITVLAGAAGNSTALNTTYTPAGKSAVAHCIRIDGYLNLTGTLRDFSPSATYKFFESGPSDLHKIDYVTNGTFASDSGWTKGSGWSIAGGVATCSGANSELSQNLSVTYASSHYGSKTMTVVPTYKFMVTYTLTCTAGTITPCLGGTNGTARSSAGTYTEEITCGSTDSLLRFKGSSTFKGTISNVSVVYRPENMVNNYNTSYPLYAGHPILKDYDGPWWNPDFESSDTYAGLMTDLVSVDLGSNNKPVFNSAKAWTSSCNSVVHGEASFNAWWTDFPAPHGPGSAEPYQMQYTIPLAEVLPATNPKTYKYTNDAQFPIDGQLQGTYIYNNKGTGSYSGTRGGSSGHNFHYTYELHTTFTYASGQKFDFKGDDDVWVFINKKLVIDLGCIHSELSKSITLNSEAVDTKGNKLNLVEGQSYQFDFFYCERHTTASHMTITTSIPLDSTDIPK